MPKKVFVSGCYDLLHSGHVEFFRQAAEYGDLYVGIGSDKTYLGYKHRKTIYSEQERLFMVKSIRYVKDAYINAGSGVMDFVPTLDIVKPDVFVVNSDGGSEEKRRCCEERGIEYVELSREPHRGLAPRSSTALKKTESQIPTRLDLAGTWIDQPYVSQYAPGWALTISLEPTFEIRERCGLSTSTRNMIRKIWPYSLPNMDPETLAKLVFCFENDPERSDGIISGAQDAIGICVPPLLQQPLLAGEDRDVRGRGGAFVAGEPSGDDSHGTATAGVQRGGRQGHHRGEGEGPGRSGRPLLDGHHQ